MMSFFVSLFRKTRVAFALVFLFCVYDLLVIKTPALFFKDIFGLRYAVNYGVSLIALFFFFLILENIYRRNAFGKVLAVLLLIVPLGLQTAHYQFYNKPLNAYGIRFFFHDPLLSLQFGSENIRYSKCLLFVGFFVALLVLVRNFERRSLANQSEGPRSSARARNAQLAIWIALFCPLVVLCGVNWYLILDYQNSITSAYASVPEVVRSFYFKQLKAKKPSLEALTNTHRPMPNIVWIIGESVSKSHMSLYGYKRSTTPHLDALKKSGQLVAFENAVSIGPHTIISVPYMMVGLQNIDPQGRIYSSPNIFEYAKARHYHTAFLSSQDLRWRNFDQLVGGDSTVVDDFRSGPDFSANVSVAKGADDMKVLHGAILPYLKEITAPFFLVAHMDGSHYPYKTHSEPAYKVFLPEKDPNDTNAYDNTIVYSDIYLARLIQQARQKDPNVWIFYTTDHGQIVDVPDGMGAAAKPIPLADPFLRLGPAARAIAVDEAPNRNKNKIIFNQGYDKDIIHNALFVVPPPKFRRALAARVQDPVAQSDIFATILDLMDVQHPLAPIDGLSLLKPIPKGRLRISTGFVTTNDNVPEAQVTFPDYSSIFIDFSRKSISLNDGKTVIPLDHAPKNIRKLFPDY